MRTIHFILGGVVLLLAFYAKNIECENNVEILALFGEIGENLIPIYLEEFLNQIKVRSEHWWIIAPTNLGAAIIKYLQKVPSAPTKEIFKMPPPDGLQEIIQIYFSALQPTIYSKLHDKIHLLAHHDGTMKYSTKAEIVSIIALPDAEKDVFDYLLTFAHWMHKCTAKNHDKEASMLTGVPQWVCRTLSGGAHYNFDHRIDAFIPHYMQLTAAECNDEERLVLFGEMGPKNIRIHLERFLKEILLRSINWWDVVSSNVSVDFQIDLSAPTENTFRDPSPEELQEIVELYFSSFKPPISDVLKANVDSIVFAGRVPLSQHQIDAMLNLPKEQKVAFEYLLYMMYIYEYGEAQTKLARIPLWITRTMSAGIDHVSHPKINVLIIHYMGFVKNKFL